MCSRASDDSDRYARVSHSVFYFHAAQTNCLQKTAVASLQTSSLTQSITFAILDAWGYDAFKIHTRTVSQFYREKRDVFEAAMRRYLDGLAEWDTPEAGMFFW